MTLSLFCRDSDSGRGSVASRGSKHDSIQLGNIRSSQDIRHVSIELSQLMPIATTSAAGSDRVRNRI